MVSLSKNSLLKVVSTLFFLSLSYYSAAQSPNEYVITNLGDTIPCKITNQFMGAAVYVSTDGKKRGKVKVKMVKEYYDVKRKHVFKAMKLPDFSRPMFVERLETGTINLYELYITTSTGGGGAFGAPTGSRVTQQWYVTKKGSDSLYLIKINTLFNGKTNRGERKASLYLAIGDDPELLQQFKDKDKYGYDEIRAVIKRYNENHPMI